MKKIIITMLVFLLSISNTIAFDYGDWKYINDTFKQKVDTLLEKTQDSKKVIIQDKVKAFLKKTNLSENNRNLLQYIDYNISSKWVVKKITVKNIPKIKTTDLNIQWINSSTWNYNYKTVKTIRELFKYTKDNIWCLSYEEINQPEISYTITWMKTKYIIPNNSLLKITFDYNDNINRWSFDEPLDISQSLSMSVCWEHTIYLTKKWFTKIEEPIVTTSRACTIVWDADYQKAMDEYLKSKNFINDATIKNRWTDCLSIINADIIEAFWDNFYNSVKNDQKTLSSLYHLIVYNWLDATKKLNTSVIKSKDWLYYNQFLDINQKIDQGKIDTYNELQNLVDNLTKWIDNNDKKIEVIFNWIVNNIKYDEYTNSLYANYTNEQQFQNDFGKNSKINAVIYGISTYKNKSGICMGYSQLFYTMLLMTWIENQDIVTWLIGKVNVNSKHHSWNRVGSYYYDTTFWKYWYKLTKDNINKDRTED